MFSDPEIVRRVLDGDTDAFADLVERYKNQVFRLAYTMTGNPRDAEDLAQETFVRAYRSLKLYRPDRPFFPWLYTICLNLTRNMLKKTGRTFSRENEDAGVSGSSSGDPADSLERRQEIENLARLLKKLPFGHAEAVVLRYLEEMPFKEIAGVLGISESAAKMRVARGVEKLRAMMAE